MGQSLAFDLLQKSEVDEHRDLQALTVGLEPMIKDSLSNCFRGLGLPGVSD
jgi:hypothetical protein